ncbi:hypothetical protein M5689_019602 [Euphorbia peplus]|nr:hypothetical protein M5689_019602 [Euphorbia peplus]
MLLQPKVVVVTKIYLSYELLSFTYATITSSDSVSVRYYSENETLDLNSMKEGSDLQNAVDLVAQLKWSSIKQENTDIARLKQKLFINDGKYRLLSENEMSNSLQMRPLIIGVW